MTIFHALILGIVQGIAEFLPISSSGHLILVPELFGWETQSLAFDAIIHIATLAAVCFALWGDLSNIGTSLFQRKDSAWKRLGYLLVIATIPVVFFGLVFKDAIETTLRTPVIVAGSLALWGIFLYVADRLVKKHAIDSVKDVGWKTAILIGLAQAIALIPGTSRSGITITAGLFAGLNRETAARFSFLLGIPAIALAGASAIFDVVEGGVDVAMIPLVVGFISAFFTGILSIQFLLSLMKRGSYIVFAAYRVVLALFILSVFF